ncbi:MAG: hypothetical protein PVF70_08400 [Anaerolineales bacterium]
MPRSDAMAGKALFAGLIVDENENPVDVAIVGGEAYYVVDDNGFRRHIESVDVDRQVLEHLRELMRGHEALISEGTMKMLGQEDIFTKAAIEASLRKMDEHIESLLDQGLPEELRAYLGMLGFRVVIDIHGQVIRVEQPSSPEQPFE